MSLMSVGCRDGEIKRTLAERYKVKPRTVEDYIAEGRRRLRSHIEMSKSDLQAESVAFYQSVLRDTKASKRDRLYARKRIDELLGLEAPQRLEHSGPEGGPLQHQLSDEPIEPDPDAWAAKHGGHHDSSDSAEP